MSQYVLKNERVYVKNNIKQKNDFLLILSIINSGSMYFSERYKKNVSVTLNSVLALVPCRHSVCQGQPGSSVASLPTSK